MQRNDVMHLAD